MDLGYIESKGGISAGPHLEERKGSRDCHKKCECILNTKGTASKARWIVGDEFCKIKLKKLC